MAFEKKPDYMRMERRQLLNLLFLNSTYIVHKYTHNFSWRQIKNFSEIQKYKIGKGQLKNPTLLKQKYNLHLSNYLCKAKTSKNPENLQKKKSKSP